MVHTTRLLSALLVESVFLVGPTWARAACIVFALSPNSASCERVFSLLKVMFGIALLSALADYIRAALMLRYNGRRVG